MKRKFEIVPVLLLVLVVALGFYRGGFAVSTSAPAAGTNNVNLTLDTGQVQEDAQTVKDKAAEMTSPSRSENP